LPYLSINFYTKINAQEYFPNNESVQNKTTILLLLNAKIFVSPTQIIEKELCLFRMVIAAGTSVNIQKTQLQSI
jgi:hypothetical protein